MTPPCRDCPNRATACWGYCEKYKAFKAETHSQNEARKKVVAPIVFNMESYHRYKARAAKAPKQFRVFK